MEIELNDPRLTPVKEDIKRALAAGYSGRVFTEEGLLDNLRRSFGPEIAWQSAVNFDDMVRSMPEFKEFFTKVPTPEPEAPKATAGKTDLK